ncbi:hypothetical protein [Cryobacterium roopkundense]|uniref:DUF4287 domain-containing protein n=1 Tax=Cryobacterium roopkundense TaxID=1001240 RepID=A0A7W8ZU15_9MICO|nr:hypothetical protein [Cryobacterium roopkundense]MBB5640063.1 hypothetical protein [Cryobacterium roopkundense]
MSDSPVSSRTDGMSDAALGAATGRGWAQWFDLLDAAGGAGWTHQKIAKWLAETHAVPAWWCQSVAVGFEQARGMRVPGQRADGSFEVGASKTIPLTQRLALDAVVRVVTAGLGVPPVSEGREAKFITARWTLPGRQSVLARANPTSAGGTSVTLTHERLPDAVAVAPAKDTLKAWLVTAASDGVRGLG